MAREEFDREDLIREATGLIDRVEYKVSFVKESVVVGFRLDGTISFFFGQARVYQFNAKNELRRGHLDGRLFKAERGRLVRLTRNRVDDQVELLRHDLSDAEQNEFTKSAISHIVALKQQIDSSEAVVLRSVSSTDNETAAERVSGWLSAWTGKIAIADTPRLVTPKRKK